MTYNLVLLRHGESQWNQENLFAGWVDVPLTDRGGTEAARAGELLAAIGLLPDVSHTSRLKRAILTADLALEAADRLWIDVKRSWRLNERHYGALQGKSKKAIRDEFGEEQFMAWRRSYDSSPPGLQESSEWSPTGDPRYANLNGALPQAESLSDVVVRLLPYWYDSIVPDLQLGRTVLVTAHSNSLRALVKHLDGISDADIPGLNIPTGIPLHYELDVSLSPVNPGGTYLDPTAAERGITHVAEQGH